MKLSTSSEKSNFIWFINHNDNVDIERSTYLPTIDIRWHLVKYLPTSSCQRSFWTTPWLLWMFAWFFTNQWIKRTKALSLHEWKRNLQQSSIRTVKRNLFRKNTRKPTKHQKLIHLLKRMTSQYVEHDCEEVLSKLIQGFQYECEFLFKAQNLGA